MHLFAFPVEVRLKIYSELLVHRGPINFPVTSPATSWRDLSSRKGTEGIDLCPALLCASKQVYGEAISLLYSGNCFRFSNLGAASTRCHTTIATFVRQIGAQASLIRHACIDFPTTPLAEDYMHHSGLQEEGLDNLDLLRDACTGITTLELSLPSERADFVLRDSSVFTELLDLLHTRLEAFQSLREVRVDVKLLGWDLDEDGAEDPEDDEQEDPHDDRWKIHRDSLRQLCSRGWAVNITKVPLVKEVRTSPDRFEFDIEDYYNDEMIRLTQEREDEEYYRQRQVESYWRDYADDGGPA